MKSKVIRIGTLALLGAIVLVSGACSKDTPEGSGEKEPADPPVVEEEGIDLDSYSDTYAELAPVENVYKWGPYNVHDPSVVKTGDTYYLYNTDVAYGAEVKPGIQIRKSKDLVEWDFVGWVFDGIPDQGRQFIESKGGTPFNSLWAPYIMKHGSEYRLYYSLTCSIPRLSVIGLAVSDSPIGPWEERGLVVTSQNDNITQTNAIDPSVVVTPSGEQWFYYGSAWDGIYMLPLDPETGLAANSGDKGVRVAQRGFTNGQVNGNIEGPEVIYNAGLQMYYMFIAYDWLQTKYNVRVGRSSSPDGPFLDFDGNDINTEMDNGPMILAPYQFDGHWGWQGVSHPGVFDDGNGNYYMAHQGRPGVDSFFMVLHVRKIHWTEDGWPVVSPERYAAVEQETIDASELAGEYEQIILGYNVVPGYDQEQTSPDFQTAFSLTIDAGGTLNGDSNNTWSYEAPWLTLNWGNGYSDKLHVERGRDWENKVASTLLLTGLNNDGTAIWGKKK